MPDDPKGPGDLPPSPAPDERLAHLPTLEELLAALPKSSDEILARMERNHGRYILIGHDAIQCDDLMEWARWMEDRNVRRVRLTRVGPYVVSTIFLGLDHSFLRHIHADPSKYPPILFETMVWTDMAEDVVTPAIPEAGIPERVWKNTRAWEDIQERCSTWAEAELQHQGIIAQILADNPGDKVEEVTE
jgi:hypothetical protein